MDRQTRKANFKKLQEPATKKQRSTRSNKAATLSDFFNTPENSGNEAICVEPANPEQKVTSNKDEPKAKKTRETRQVSPPARPKPKKAPKLKTTTATQRNGRGGSRGRSKQQPSISDFLRNEQLFAEVTAQHCIAENFSPNDIEMALALSKSEAEKHGRLRLQDTTQERDEVVNMLDPQAGQSTENVRLKLQKYGFRTAAKEDYNMLSIAALPAGKRGKRGKWANKFTPLTLRNPVEQLRKSDAKVAALMAQQVRTKQPSTENHYPFELVSLKLQKLEATAEHRIINHERSEEPLAYYVQDLFEVSRTPAHHLLKNWAAIQGRDLSPKKLSKGSLRRKQQLERVYAELEAYFGATAEKEELDELEKLLVVNMVQENSHSTVEIVLQDEQKMPVDNSQLSTDLDKVAISGGSPIKEPPDKRPKMMLQLSSDKENTQPSTSSNLSIPTLTTRCTSPDLFADSEEDEQEDEIPKACSEEMQNFSLKVYKNITPSEISCYEIYSSDEVKTFTNDKVEEKSIEATSIESPIDLTQDQDTPEFIPNVTSNISLLEQQNVLQSPIMEFDEKLDAFAMKLDTQSADFSNSNELLDKADFELSSTAESQHNEIFLNMSSNSSAQSNPTTSTNNSKDLILSFTQLETPKQAFQRSFSLTQSPRKSLHLEHSFKSPLSRRSNSFVEKPTSTFKSPFSQSDASIDLTQDSDDDKDNEGVLLSDDEINYSIWKADKTCLHLDEDLSSENESTYTSPLTKVRTVPYFKTIEDLDAYLDNSPTSSIKSCNSRSPNKSALSKERAEFGILDAAISQPFTLSQLPSPTRAPNTESQFQIDWTEASFLETQPEAPLKRYSHSCSHKFKDLLKDITEPDNPIEDNDDEIDEFDRLVFQNSRDSTVEAMPSGLDRLLMGEINVDSLPEPISPEHVSPAKVTAVSDKLELNGEVYNISICQTPKPDFVHLSEAELLQQLYNYGIKPLKRKQAVKLLEFIYNQTHPIMLPSEEPEPQRLLHSRSKSTPLNGSINSKSRGQLLHNASNDCLSWPKETAPKITQQKFRDAPGTELLRFSQALPPALCDDFECFVLQTNVSKKTPQPLLPLHIAWHNLICANPSLHESVLMFEPIDLQEIYLYLKELGYRYDPKELKCFFDRRCIIFRYELAPPAKQAQRHIRKPKFKKANFKS